MLRLVPTCSSLSGALDGIAQTIATVSKLVLIYNFDFLPRLKKRKAKSKTVGVIFLMVEKLPT